MTYMYIKLFLYYTFFYKQSNVEAVSQQAPGSTSGPTNHPLGPKTTKRTKNDLKGQNKKLKYEHTRWWGWSAAKGWAPLMEVGRWRHQHFFTKLYILMIHLHIHFCTKTFFRFGHFNGFVWVIRRTVLITQNDPKGYNRKFKFDHIRWWGIFAGHTGIGVGHLWWGGVKTSLIFYKTVFSRHFSCRSWRHALKNTKLHKRAQ